MVLLEEGHDVEDISKLSGRSQQGLKSKFNVKPRPHRLTAAEGPTSCRSVKQYRSIEELYADFGEICPTDPEELQKDIDKRYQRWRQKMLGEIA